MLCSARSSVLVNGSPTQEFQIQIGLRQGDHISHFLFILAREGLHVAFLRARLAGVFRGISFGDIEISHLSYADDVVILSLWSLDDDNHIICILSSFFLDLSLKINLHKSRLIGAGIPSC